MPNRFTQAAKLARESTNKQLATEIAAITNINREDLTELLPAKKDKEAFLALMEQVEADTAMDEKLAYLTKNIETAGVMALKLLKALI